MGVAKRFREAPQRRRMYSDDTSLGGKLVKEKAGHS